MQAAAVCFTGALPIKKSTKSLVPKTSTKIQRRTYYTKAAKVADTEASTVDYSSSLTSVFPAEACETIGGEACNVDMYPEAKLQASAANRGEANERSEEVEREYLEYDQSKTVFPGEACDDLGGEFCDPEYQAGVYKESN